MVCLDGALGAQDDPDALQSLLSQRLSATARWKTTQSAFWDYESLPPSHWGDETHTLRL